MSITPRDAELLAQVRLRISTGEAKSRRVEARLSTSEVAGACQVNPSTIWRWESGNRTPKGQGALRYARLLDRLKAIQ